jgi:hypothetical protein
LRNHETLLIVRPNFDKCILWSINFHFKFFWWKGKSLFPED